VIVREESKLAKQGTDVMMPRSHAEGWTVSITESQLDQGRTD
jgi:hypothetical protein